MEPVEMATRGRPLFPAYLPTGGRYRVAGRATGQKRLATLDTCRSRVICSTGTTSSTPSGGDHAARPGETQAAPDHVAAVRFDAGAGQSGCRRSRGYGLP